MVERQLRVRGIRDERVLEAMGRVPREAFVPHETVADAYADRALPIGSGQTISQPYVVALTLEAAAIGADDVVLDVGTGSGYAAALASCMAARVFTVERDARLAAAASERLRRLGFVNVRCAAGDASRGWPDHAPFHAILAAAAASEVPQQWLDELAPGGRIVVPLGPPDAQNLVRIVRGPMGLRRTKLLAVRYVPLVPSDGDLIELP